MTIIKTIISEDVHFIYGKDERRDRHGNIEAVTEWSRYKGRPYVPLNLNDQDKKFAQNMSTLLINDCFALAEEFGVEFRELVPLNYLPVMSTIMFKLGWIEKKHFKDFTRRWLMGEKSFRELLDDPKYAKADESVVDNAIEEVYNEHGSKYDGTDKVLNWLVGQVMKKTQGKAQAASVKEKMLSRLG